MSARSCPAADAPLTAHHQQQDDQQRGHEHQQGQPHVVPHLERREAAASGSGRRTGFSGGRRGPGAAWAAGARGGWHGGGHCGAQARDPPLGAGGARLGGRPRGAPTPSSLWGVAAQAPGDPSGGRMRFHGGRRASEEKERVSTETHGGTRPWLPPARESLGPQGRQMSTSPGGGGSCSSRPSPPS